MPESVLAEPPGAAVRMMVAGQFPAWEMFSVDRVASTGTDNYLYRLGETLAVRIPKHQKAERFLLREAEWLPQFSELALPVAAPVAVGSPCEGTLWHWGVSLWIDGQTVDAGAFSEMDGAAAQLAGFLKSLRAQDVGNALLAGPDNEFRGGALAQWRQRTLQALDTVSDEVDQAGAAAVFDRAVTAGAAPEVRWIHGDLHPGNLVVTNDRLAGVIDFGLMAVGDPACDVKAAWWCFAPDGREAFRKAMDIDEAEWDRARGWALCTALIALAFYRGRNEPLADMCRFAVKQVLSGV
ncbi:MAG: aminoglycoside phosphotransferase family protein [Hyphomonas sp.]